MLLRDYVRHSYATRMHMMLVCCRCYNSAAFRAIDEAIIALPR